MSTGIKAIIVLFISIFLVEISGFWFIKRGKELSQSLYSNIGIIICVGALLILFVGILIIFM